MKNRGSRYVIFASVAVGLFLAASGQGAVIVPNVVHVSMAFNWQGQGPGQLIDSVGLTTSGNISTWTQATGGGGVTGMWMNEPYYSHYHAYGSAPFGSGEWILANFNTAVDLSKLWLWQFNDVGTYYYSAWGSGTGVKNFRVYASSGNDTGDEGSGPLLNDYVAIDGGVQQLAQVSGLTTIFGSPFSLTGATGVRSVLINVISSYDGAASDVYTGLSEIRFETAGGGQDPVPEPGTWMILVGSLLGLVAGGFRRIRRRIAG